MRHIRSNRPYKPTTGLQGTTLHKKQGCVEEMADFQGAAGEYKRLEYPILPESKKALKE